MDLPLNELGQAYFVFIFSEKNITALVASRSKRRVPYACRCCFRLYPSSTLGHGCDVCQQRMKAKDAKAWRCKVCDFDLCRSCYDKKVCDVLMTFCI